MLYLLHGTDTQKARAKLHKLVEGLLKKKPDASYFKLDDEKFEAALLEEYIGGQGLFANKYIVLLDKIFVNTDAKDVVLKQLKAITQSDNIFILLEETLDKKTLTKLEKQAEKVQAFELKAGGKKKADFNIFTLTDAFGARDKGKLWVLYQRALRAGSTPEEIHGILFWQLKTMLQVAGGSTVGLKPFVATKAKRFVANYSHQELKHLASAFVALYHDARRGLVDFEARLEQLTLSL